MSHATQSQPAYSLVFAFFIMTVVMIVAGTTIENTQEKVRYFQEIEGSSQARLAAESAAELALLEIKDYEAGYEPTSDEAFCKDAISSSDVNGSSILNCETQGSYEVFGTAAENEYNGSGYYSPIPGSGDAAPSDDCSILDDHKPVDHPCNWNKLLYGESVSIPLYADDGFGGTHNPYELGLTGWKLKVRTPCSDGSYDSDCERYELNGDSDDYENDENLISWQLNGTDADGNSVESLFADDTTDLERDGVIRNEAQNTEIPESLINESSDQVVLQTSSDSSSAYYNLYESTLNTDLETLFLQLDLIAQLEDSEGNTVPYLEWQLVVDSTDPVANLKYILIGEGYQEGRNKVFYFPYIINREVTGESTSIYTLAN